MSAHENAPANGSPKQATSNMWKLNYLLQTSLNFIYTRLIDFWIYVSHKIYFKKYVILLPTSVVVFILCIIIFNLFRSNNEDKSESRKLEDVKLCLEEVTVVFENTKNFDILKKCDIINETVQPKTKIRFVMGASQFFDCIIQGVPNCEEHLEKEIQVHINEYSLKDIYFNYIIRYQPEFHIYEGRSLSCNFDEYVITENHESLIVIGIPQCSSLGRVKEFDKNKFNEFLQNFLDCFETSGLLTNNYKIEFHESCKYYAFSEKTLKSYYNKIVFIDDDKIMNADYYFTSSTLTMPS